MEIVYPIAWIVIHYIKKYAFQVFENTFIISIFLFSDSRIYSAYHQLLLTAYIMDAQKTCTVMATIWRLISHDIYIYFFFVVFIYYTNLYVMKYTNNKCDKRDVFWYARI